jgi:TP901 family phage tail tape measure protein
MAADNTTSVLGVQVVGAQAIQQVASASQSLNTVLSVMASTMQRLNSTSGLTAAQLTSLGRSTATISSNLSKFQGMTGNISNSLNGMSNSAKGFVLSWSNVERIVIASLISRAVRELASQFEQSLEKASEFQKRIAEIQTISQDTVTTFNQFAEGVRNVSESWGIDILKVAEAEYQIISNQVAKGADSFKVLSEAAALSKVTMSDVATSVQAITGVLNAYQMDVSRVHEVSAQLYKIVELGRLRLDQFGNTLGNVSIVAAQLGISFQDLGASMIVLTRLGVTPAQAMTELRSIMMKLMVPTKDLKELFKEWGVETAEEALQTWTYAGVLEKLAEAASKGNSAVQEMAEGFRNVRAVTGIVGLASNINLVRESLKKLEEAVKDYGKAITITKKPPAFEYTQELEKIKNFFIVDIGQTLLKDLVDITRGMGGLSAVMKELVKVAVDLGIMLGAAFIANRVTNITLMWIATIRLNTALQATKVAAASAATGIATINTAAVAAYSNAAGAIAMLASLIIAEMIRTNMEAKRSVEEYGREEKRVVEETASAVIQAQRDKLNIQLDLYKQNTDAALRSIRQILAEEMAAINKLKAAKETQLGLEKLIFDMKMKVMTPAAQAALIANKLEQDFVTILELKVKAEKQLAEDNQKGFNETFKVIEKLVVQIDGYIEKLKGLKNVKFIPEVPPEMLQNPLGNFNNLPKLDGFFTTVKKPLEDMGTAADFIIPRFEKLIGLLEGLQQKSKELSGNQMKTDFGPAADYEEKIKGMVGQIAAYNKQIVDTRQLGEKLGEEVATGVKESFKTFEELRKKFETLYTEGFGKDIIAGKIFEQTGEALGVLQDHFRTAIARGMQISPEELNQLKQEIKTVFEGWQSTDPMPLINKIFGPKVLEEFESKLKQISTKLTAAVSNQNQIKTANKSIDELVTKSAKIQSNMAEAAEKMEKIANLPKGSAQALIDHLQNLYTITSTTVTQMKTVGDAINTAGVTIDLIIPRLMGLNDKLANTAEALRNAAAALRETIAAEKAERALKATEKFYGGYISRFSSGGVASDQIPAWLSKGEVVMNRMASTQYLPQLMAMNNRTRGFNSGGNVTNVGDINVTVQGGDSSELTIRNIADGLRRGLRRGMIRLT